MKWILLEKKCSRCVEPDVLGGNVDLLEMSVLFARDNWVEIQWRGAKGINVASVKRIGNLVV